MLFLMKENDECLELFIIIVDDTKFQQAQDQEKDVQRQEIILFPT